MLAIVGSRRACISEWFERVCMLARPLFGRHFIVYLYPT